MRRWWGIRGHDREVSRSMVAAVVFGVLALGIGLSSWVPRLFGAGVGVTSVEPGRLLVAPAATGVVTLGSGYTVALYPSGFRYAKEDETMAETVTKGSPVVALMGSVSPESGLGPGPGPGRGPGTGPGTTAANGNNAGDNAGGRERVAGVLNRVELTTLDITPGQARWTGEITGTVDGRARRAPVDWQVQLQGDRVVTTVSVKGADGLVLPLDWRPAVTGLAPALPERNLRLKQWWFTPGAGVDRAFTWVLGTNVGLGPASVPRAADLAVDGRIDLHVWSGTATMTLTGLPRDRAKLAS